MILIFPVSAYVFGVDRPGFHHSCLYFNLIVLGQVLYSFTEGFKQSFTKINALFTEEKQRGNKKMYI